MTYLINGPHPLTHSIVARYLLSQQRRSLAYHLLVKFAQYEKDAFRAQAHVTRNLHPITGPHSKYHSNNYLYLEF